MSAGPLQTAPRRQRGLPLLAVCAVLALGAMANLGYLLSDSALDLSGDEAHYWEWSRHLDLSYYSKGPLVAYIIAASRALLAELSERWVGSEALAVRAPAMALSVLTGLGMYALSVATLRRAGLALAAVVLAGTIPILATGAVLMTIDAPLACAWTWALLCVERALRRDSAIGWVWAGVLIAFGILAKYTMLLIFPVVGLLLLSEPALRTQLKRPGPYLAAGIGLLGLVPILIWNAQHEWVSFRHVAGQAGLARLPRIEPLGMLTYLGGQLAVAGLVWPVAMWAALVGLYRRPVQPDSEPQDTRAVRLLLYAAAVPWLVFLLFSPITKIQPNWPAVSLVPATILLTLWLVRRLSSADPAARRRTRVLIAAGVLVGGSTVVLSRRTDWLMPAFAWLARGAPPLGLTRAAPPWELTPTARYDPAARLRGWSQLGRAVGEILAAQRAVGRDPFILADDYQTASLIAFYCPGQPPAYSAQAALGGRHSQYDLWTNPLRDRTVFLGRPCIYVGSLHPRLTGGPDGGHAALPGLHLVRTVECRVRGQLVRVSSIFAGDAFAGFEPRAAEAPRRY